MNKKIKNTIILSISVFILAAIVVAFSFIVLYTPNMNSHINLKVQKVLGSVTINIKEAENGAPYSYFTFEHTTDEWKEHSFVNKNLLFKGDEGKITIEFVVHSMGHYKTNLHLDLEGPGNNAKMEVLINNVKSELFTDLIFEPNEIKTISFVVCKEDVEKPIRSKFNIDFTLTRYVEPVPENPEITEPEQPGGGEEPEGTEPEIPVTPEPSVPVIPEPTE